MKTSMKQFVTITIITTFAAALTATAEIQTARGGGQALEPQVASPAPHSVTTDLTAAMPCPKCHNVKANYVTTSRGGVKEYRTVEQHVCPGCSTRIEAAGHGKAKTESVIHTCSFADKGASCCQ